MREPEGAGDMPACTGHLRVLPLGRCRRMLAWPVSTEQPSRLCYHLPSTTEAPEAEEGETPYPGTCGQAGGRATGSTAYVHGRSHGGTKIFFPSLN